MPVTDSVSFVRHACLGYGRWTPADAAEAERILAEEPALARADIFAAAAAGDVEAAKTMLDRAPARVGERGGPHGWEPLLYACYSRMAESGGRSTLEVARLLVERGADPNAGFLREGNLPPFAALTGAFGEGEG